MRPEREKMLNLGLKSPLRAPGTYQSAGATPILSFGRFFNLPAAKVVCRVIRYWKVTTLCEKVT